MSAASCVSERSDTKAHSDVLGPIHVCDLNPFVTSLVSLTSLSPPAATLPFAGSAALPSTSRRAVLVLLQTLGPYLAESASTRLDRAAEEQQQQQRERQQQQQQEAGGDDGAWRKEQRAGRSPSEAGDEFVSDALSSPDPGRSREHPTGFVNGHAAARSSNDSSSQSRGRSWWSSMPLLLQSRWVRRWLLPAWPTRIK